MGKNITMSYTRNLLVGACALLIACCGCSSTEIFKGSGAVVAKRISSVRTNGIYNVETVMLTSNATSRKLSEYPLSNVVPIALRGRQLINSVTGQRYGAAPCVTSLPEDYYAVSSDGKVLACLAAKGGDIYGGDVLHYMWLDHGVTKTMSKTLYSNIYARNIAFGKGHELLGLSLDERCPTGDYDTFPTRLVVIDLDRAKLVASGQCTASIVPYAPAGFAVKDDFGKWFFSDSRSDGRWTQGNPQAVTPTGVLYIDNKNDLRSTGQPGILLKGALSAQYWPHIPKWDRY